MMYIWTVSGRLYVGGGGGGGGGHHPSRIRSTATLVVDERSNLKWVGASGVQRGEKTSTRKTMMTASRKLLPAPNTPVQHDRHITASRKLLPAPNTPVQHDRHITASRKLLPAPNTPVQHDTDTSQPAGSSYPPRTRLYNMTQTHHSQQEALTRPEHACTT